MSIDYQETIPNNVNLGEDRRLQRALEKWQPGYLDWWRDMGPEGSGQMDVYLRTAISVEAGGWANYAHVRMPDYRWGIFLAPAEADRKINFGQHKGEPVWQEVPGEYRAELRRLIVTQGDTEPASVEQQRRLGKSCPSLYDLRNLFQVNVEEGRHLWAMVYLLHAYFGRDGREEAEEMLARHSGDEDKPRILGAFNEPTPEWLSFFMFTYFTDRDGKYQLAALAESGLDPLSRTCRFMLTEEAHHMFVGETGVDRIVKRTVELMRQHKTDDVRPFGAIDLPTLQKYINFHYSISLDLFGQELSTNAANYFTMGLKGRYRETEIDDDHVLIEDAYEVPEVSGGAIVTAQAPALTAINERLRNDYVEDCQRGVDKWNKTIRQAGVDFELTLPHRAFHREIGAFSAAHASPDGRIVDEGDWNGKRDLWLPSDEDKAYIDSLMGAVTEPGKFANWIAPPGKGIYGQPLDFDYVRFN
ncbi:MAG: benzoyl-CoA 2,3-epoxidase subunit BoxB [Proteobacteria bacterium]|nr:benzoyl-CoA 2,3-epoxidase subunit BoxB [Pseudomonadota bacterium]